MSAEGWQGLLAGVPFVLIAVLLADRGAAARQRPLLLGALAGGAAGLVLAGPAALIACALVGGWLGRVVASRRRESARVVLDLRLRLDLPDAAELLAGALDGGAPIARAAECVAQRLPAPLGPVLAAAVEAAARPDSGGLAEALAAQHPVLRSLASVLRSGEDLGVPIAPALRVLARDERSAVRLELRSRAAAAAPKLMLIVGAVIAPAALILVVGAELLSLGGSLGAVP